MNDIKEGSKADDAASDTRQPSINATAWVEGGKYYVRLGPLAEHMIDSMRHVPDVIEEPWFHPDCSSDDPNELPVYEDIG